ncbi:site-specific integrase [Amycolatopsis japonica]|uniref:site-specific integrase n=1 Tax=Amycolatopsis japonica TaxID=208439 RepID=UPI003324FA8B
MNDPLYPLYHLIAHVGLRRGEACGQRRADTYLDAATLEVANQIVQYGWETGQSAPKTNSSEGLVALDANTVLVLRQHIACQDADKARLGSDWVDSGLLFTQPDGSPLHPADITERFYEIVRQAGLPPIRLHDLRHGAATLALAAGADMKVVQAMLRHSSITVTMDTYTTVLPEIALSAAEATAKLIPRSTSRPRQLGTGVDQPSPSE